MLHRFRTTDVVRRNVEEYNSRYKNVRETANLIVCLGCVSKPLYNRGCNKYNRFSAGNGQIKNLKIILRNGKIYWTKIKNRT